MFDNLHHNSPDYDSRDADRCADEANEGSASMRHAPALLLYALASWLDTNPGHEDAVRELLLPLYLTKQSAALQALHRAFSRSDDATDVAELALKLGQSA